MYLLGYHCNGFVGTHALRRKIGQLHIAGTYETK